MCRLVVLLVLLLGGNAFAERLVIMDPPVVRKCPVGKTWNEVTTCLAKHGTVKVVRQLKGARLISLTQTQNGKLRDSGLFLYVERKNQWKLGGLWEAYGEYQLLAFEQVTIGKRSGFRLDVGQASPFTLLVDGVSPVPALIRTQRSLFCSGDNYGCSDATTACEVLVRGNARFTFRGTLSIEENVVHVKGDRSRAGPHCMVAPRVFLGWTQP